MLRKLGLIVLLSIILVVMLVFTQLNPGVIDIDLAFATVRASMPLAFTSAFALGWLFGLLCAAAFALRVMNDRRQLRKALRNTESELSSLRSKPLSDAD